MLAVVARGVRTVPQGYEWTVERFGRYRITLSPGLRLINPFTDAIGHKINVQETVLEIPPQNVITKDNAVVVVDGIVFYQVFDASRAAYEVRDLELAVSNITMTNIRTAIGALDLDETLSKRDEINERLLRVLDAATEPWGTKITRVELKDVRPPEDVQVSMAKQLAADRERRAAILRAEGLKQAAILEAQGAKEAQILAAEGKLEAARREAEARERLAEAEARATTVVSKAVADGDVQALNYFVAQKYVEAITQIGASPNSRLVLMPMETAGWSGRSPGSPNSPGLPSARRSSRHGRHFGGLAVVGLDRRWPASLALAEMVVPGAYLMWIALGAAVTALAAGATGMILEGQLAVFAIATSVSCLGGYFVYRALVPMMDRDGDVPLNAPRRSMIGAHGTVCEAFVNGRGKVRIGDTVWLADGPDLAEGSPGGRRRRPRHPARRDAPGGRRRAETGDARGLTAAATAFQRTTPRSRSAAISAAE